DLSGCDMCRQASLIVVSIVLLSLGATAAPLAAQSLADVARQEQDRRKAIKKPAKVLTNKDLGAPLPATGTAATPATGVPGNTDADKCKTAGNGTEKKAEEPARDQASWSGRAKDLQ